MEIYQHMHSILTLDGEKFLVHLSEWADRRLDEDRRRQFFRDLAEIHEFYSDRILEEIYSTAGGPNGVPALIGYRYIHPTGKQYNEKYEYWCNEFANDPAVQYNPEIRIQ
jgi:hypothetical protein